MKRIFLALIGFLWSSSVSAQDQSPTSVRCELHFWGSNKAQTSNYSGVGGALGGALAGPRPQTKDALSADLPNEAQAEVIRHIDLASILKVSAVDVVSESQPLTTKPGSSGPRLTDSNAPCYMELVVDFIGYSSHITAGRKFGARFWLRRYPTPGESAKIQNGGADVKLRLYPAKKPEDRQAALGELHSAFGQVATKFLASKAR